MLSEAKVVEAARSAGLASPVHYFDVTGSTNTELLRLAEAGAPSWTVVVAGHQREGRGRVGRTWVSAPGSSLLVSVLIRPEAPTADSSLIALGAGASMAQACAAGCGVAARCKWPNDVVVGARKLGGILVEAKVQSPRPAHAVIGAGVNVIQDRDDFPPDLRSTASSIALEHGTADFGALLYEYLVRVRLNCDPARPTFRDSVLDQYQGMCDTIGRNVRALTISGQSVVGRAVGVDERGRLVVDTGEGMQKVGFGEIAHLD